MDSRIKSKNAVCDYTGEETSSVIKIYGVEDSEGKSKETGWMSEEVLVHALKMIRAVKSPEIPQPEVNFNLTPPGQFFEPGEITNTPGDGPTTKVQHVTEATTEAIGQSQAAVVRSIKPERAPRTPGRNPKDPREVVKQFEEAVVELKENPPKTRESDPDGVVPESSIRELIKNFMPYFRNNPNQMFTPCRIHFGIEAGRFRTIVDGLRKQG